jgi:hypothetical protein
MILQGPATSAPGRVLVSRNRETRARFLLTVTAIAQARRGGSVDRPYPWLKYLNADDLANDVEFTAMPVTNRMGEKLGSVDGFIVDSTTGRPYYVVVDAGGWFKSKHFLLPVGHASIEVQNDKEALVADVERDRIRRFPGFDKDNFEQISPEAIKAMNDDICIACGVEVVSYPASEPYDAAWNRRDFATPDWWHSEPSLPDRMGDRAFSERVDYPKQSAAEQRADNARRGQSSSGDIRSNERAAADDPSPHYGGRAQPGDVIGLETGGERTYVGDTADDENKRREAAERAASRR